jgi:hypothetical protein
MREHFVVDRSKYLAAGEFNIFREDLQAVGDINQLWLVDARKLK